MNKLIGYCEIGPDKVPAKIGLFVLEKVCKYFEVELDQIGELFEKKKYKDQETGEDKEGYGPKDLPHFLAVLIFYSVNYAGKLGGTRILSSIEEAYEVIDDAGGINGDGCSELIAQFMASTANGGTPVKSFKKEDESKKKDE